MSSGSRPYCRHTALHVDVIGARRFERVGQAIDHIGGSRCQFTPVLGRAGLHDHRVALRGRGDVQRAAHREVFALVIEHMPLAFVVELARRFVVEEGIRVPGVPQPLYNVDEFARALVPGGVIELGGRG